MKLEKFLTNYAKSSYSEGVILKNGSTRSGFRSVWDKIKGRKPQDYFIQNCDTLNDCLDQRLFDKLTLEDQLSILIRMKKIRQKIGGNNLKANLVIQKLESAIFDRENDAKVAAESIKLLNSITRRHSTSKLTARREKFALILNHYQAESAVFQWILRTLKQGNYTAQEMYEAELYSSLLKKANKNDPAALELYVNNFFQLLSSGRIGSNETKDLNNLLLGLNVNEAFVHATLKRLYPVMTASIKPDYSVNERKLDRKDFYVHLMPLFDAKMAGALSLEEQLEVRRFFSHLKTPCNRTRYPNLIFSKQDQLKIINRRIQECENQFISERIDKNPPIYAPDIPKWVKLLGNNSRLTEENREKLRQQFAQKGLQNQPWGDPTAIETGLEAIVELDKSFDMVLDYSSNYGRNCSKPKKDKSLENLKRMVKMKAFFKNQESLPEDQILIPKWFHATRFESMKEIIPANKIEVRHQQAFRGAWVSTRIETDFGDHVFAFGSSIEQVDQAPYIGYTYTEKRWRGLQKTIPLKGNLACAGVLNLDKTFRKVRKLQIAKMLREAGHVNCVILNVDQIEFMQRTVQSILGCPNLNENWWSITK